MKSVLIVVALLVSTAYVQCSPNSDLLDQLDDLMFQAFQKGNKGAVNAISEAIDTVGLALLQMPAADEAQKAELQGHVDVVRDDLPKLEALVNGSIKTRGFFQDIGKAFNFVKSKATMLVQNVSKAVDSFVHNGLPQIVAVVKPFVENVIQNVHLSQVVDGLGTVTGALSQLNKITGGSIAPLSGLTDILANIESTGKFVEEMTAANNTDAIADALINTLTSAKSSHLNKIEKALDYVCVGLDQVEAAEAAKAANAA